MADEVRIDKQSFNARLSQFIAAWKADKRAGDALFAGAGSVLVIMGKSDEASGFQKSNGMHVSCHWKIPPIIW
jgi:nucleosome binding factor SPN SPT16 subunit